MWKMFSYGAGIASMFFIFEQINNPKTKIMKKITILFLLGTLWISVANAQIQKGNILAGADISNFNLTLNKGGVFSMEINPKVGFFIKDNVAVGGFFNIGLTTVKGGGSSFDYGVGGLGRYYVDKDIADVLQHGRWFVEATLGINGTNVTNGPSTNGLGFSLGPGYAYFITQNISLEALLTYQGIVGFGSQAYSNNLDLNVGFQIYIASAKAKAMMKEVK
jgi:hypothetical protein